MVVWDVVVVVVLVVVVDVLVEQHPDGLGATARASIAPADQ